MLDSKLRAYLANINFFKPSWLATPNNETNWLVVFLATHVCIWVTAPTVGFLSPPLDVVENLFWGREWLLGTYKHPPLQAWLTEIAWQTAGFMGVYALGQICVSLTAAALFLFGKAVKSSLTGIVAALVFLLSFYGTLASIEPNANIISMPSWAFSGYFFWRIQTTNADKKSWWFWVGLSLSLSLAFYTKYSVAFLLIGLFFATISLPNGRRLLVQPEIYLAAALTILFCLPNLVWLFENQFQPYQFAINRAGMVDTFQRFMNPLKFLAGVSFAFLIPLIVIIFSGGKLKRSSCNKEDTLFIYFISLVPLIAMALMSVVGGIGLKSMWGSSAAVWLPLLLAIHLTNPNKWQRIGLGKIFVMFFALILPLGAAFFSKYSESTNAPQRTGWNAPYLTKAALDGWHEQFVEPPRVVIGPTWEAGFVALFAPSRPTVLEDADYNKSPWVQPKIIRDYGALVVWSGNANRYSQLEPFLKKDSLAIWHKGKMIRFYWAVLPPVKNQS